METEHKMIKRVLYPIAIVLAILAGVLTYVTAEFSVGRRAELFGYSFCLDEEQLCVLDHRSADKIADGDRVALVDGENISIAQAALPISNPDGEVWRVRAESPAAGSVFTFLAKNAYIVYIAFGIFAAATLAITALIVSDAVKERSRLRDEQIRLRARRLAAAEVNSLDLDDDL